MEGLTTALGTAFTGVQTNVMEVLGVALPAAIGVVTVIIAIKVGIKFFKSITHG